MIEYFFHGSDVQYTNHNNQATRYGHHIVVDKAIVVMCFLVPEPCKQPLPVIQQRDSDKNNDVYIFADESNVAYLFLVFIHNTTHQKEREEVQVPKGWDNIPNVFDREVLIDCCEYNDKKQVLLKAQFFDQGKEEG